VPSPHQQNETTLVYTVEITTNASPHQHNRIHERLEQMLELKFGGAVRVYARPPEHM
jgi:hypothetical protein